MKRMISYVIICMMLMTVCPTASAQSITDSDYCLYTFENGVPEGVLYENATGAVSQGAYGGGLIVEGKGVSSVSLPFYGEPGVRYHASLWVKTEETVSVSLGGVPLSVKSTTKGEPGWTHYEGTVALPESLPDNTYLTVSAKGSFVIDDCLAYSEKREARTEGNIVGNGNFDTDLSGWTRAGITWEQIEGANGTKGALSYQVHSDFACAHTPITVYFGRRYKVSWYAKAVSEDAVGLDMKYIFDRAGTRQDMATPKYFEKVVGKLTADWQYFELDHQELNLTTDQCPGKLYFRAGTGKEKVTFAIDEVVIEEVADSYTVNSNVVLSGNPFGSEGVTASFIRQGNAEGVYYRIKQSFGEGTAIVKSGYTTENSMEYPLPSGFDGTVTAEINAKDINGIVGKTYSTTWTKTEPEQNERLLTNIREEIWTPETKTLTAEAICTDGKSGKALTAYLAAYDKKGALVEIASSGLSYTAGEKKEFSADVDGASRAKLLLFDTETLKPVKQTDEIEKTEKGTFLYVDSVKGRDFAEGTAEKPLKTLSGAKVRVRTLLKEATEDIYVVFRDGNYRQASVVTFSENDSSEKVKVSYVAEHKGKASINGGMDVEGFTLWDKDLNIYRAPVEPGTRSRQMFVDGIRATRARSKGGLENAVNLGSDGVGFTTTDTSFLSYKHIEDLEFDFFEQWTHSYVGVQGVEDNGDGTVTIVMRETDWHYQWDLKGNCLPSVPEYIENALELLDEEGEWYLDSHEGFLYYKPRVFENMETVRVTLPVCEKMIHLAGSTAFAPIRNIEFRGMVFENTTWNVPSDPGGFCCGQNNNYPNGEEKFIAGAVHVENASSVSFIGCRFARLGMTGLKMIGGLKNCDIIGNEFYDISAGALVVGDVTANTAHNPPDEAYYVENIRVTDNYMHKIAVDFKGGACLSTGFPRNSVLLNNEIYDTCYSGMHLGWGWNSYSVSVTQDFTVKANYIHKIMNTDIYDGGGVYFLGRTNGSKAHPNRFEENYLYDTGNAYGMIYPDNGSTNWDILSNVCDLTKTPVWHRNYEEGDEGYDLPARWLHIHMSTITDIYMDNNYTTTDVALNNGVTNVELKNLHVHPDAVWPQEAKDIIARSGPREQYADYFYHGLQEVDVQETVALSAGESVPLQMRVLTGKEKLYDEVNYEVYTVSKHPEVATVENGVITAHGAGTTEITIYVKEGEILKTRTVTVTVE
ncbi:MAG: hypothetical protein IJC78_06205 [Clostridia bacterium]|nr:hypothetical protein [Clostridia bacterium]